MTARPRILVVEDEDYVRASMAEVLDAEGFDVEQASSVDEAEKVLEGGGIAVVLTDLRLPGRDGLALLDGLRTSGIPVVMITGHGTVPEAVAAMKAGAFDFVQKPVEPDQLAIVIRRAAAHGQLVDEVHRLRASVDRLHGRRVLAGGSGAMENVRGMIARVARTDATVLVCGESGTGKELVAREIHRASPRAQGPLVVVNCAAVVESLFESEFFGHRKGAFSGADENRTGRFAEAEGGTLVLDEIETLSPDSQAKLLRVLESGEYQRVGDSRTRVVDVRVVAVTNESLEERVSEGTFRSDLYYRLHVFPIEMPPLREHVGDLPEIVEELFTRVRERIGAEAAVHPLDADALAALAGYDWPGNVRELRNVLERASILSQPDGRIDAELLRAIVGRSRRRAGPETLNLRERLEALERELVEEALARSSGSRKEGAKLLGVDPKNMSYYLKKHGLGGGT